MVQPINVNGFNITVLRKDTTHKASEYLWIFHNELRCFYETHTIMQIVHVAVVVINKDNIALCLFAGCICHVDHSFCFAFTFFACKNFNHCNLPL